MSAQSKELAMLSYPRSIKPHAILAAMTAMLLMGGCSEATPEPSITPTLTQSAPTPSPDVRGTEAAGNVATIWAKVTATDLAKAAQETERLATSTANSAYQATEAVHEQATLQALPDDVASIFPRAWPIEPFTEHQIQQARYCSIQYLYHSRYDDVISNDLQSAFEPQTFCDWAVLAAAFGYLVPSVPYGELPPLPDEAFHALYMTAALNPALLLRNDLARTYIGRVHLVDTIPLAEQSLVQAHFFYSYIGLGAQGEIEINITAANTSTPFLTGHWDDIINSYSGTPPPDVHRQFSQPINASIVNNLGASLTDLIPVQAQFAISGCADAYGHWSGTLEYTDGTIVTLVGDQPWQVEVNGDNYLQYGDGIPRALNSILESLEIPFLSQVGMTCLRGDLLDLAYPQP
jgi:hypothetical protein